jgi:carbonic anhydrase
MMLFHALFAVAGLVPAIFACPEHDYVKPSRLQGRQTNPTEPEANNTKNDWAYEASFNWGKVRISLYLRIPDVLAAL